MVLPLARDRPFVFLSTAKPDGARARFDEAHELGHLVLHPGRDFDALPDDQAEREANAFASAFFLPAETFGYEAPSVLDLPVFERLRSRWGASIQAMVRRLRDLGRFTPWQYEHAMVRMSSLGWRSGPEPGAPKREESFVHARLLDRLGDLGPGPREFARDLHLSLEDVCTLIRRGRLRMRDRLMSSGERGVLRDSLGTVYEPQRSARLGPFSRPPLVGQYPFGAIG